MQPRDLQWCPLLSIRFSMEPMKLPYKRAICLVKQFTLELSSSAVGTEAYTLLTLATLPPAPHSRVPWVPKQGCESMPLTTAEPQTEEESSLSPQGGGGSQAGLSMIPTQGDTRFLRPCKEMALVSHRLRQLWQTCYVINITPWQSLPFNLVLK